MKDNIKTKVIVCAYPEHLEDKINAFICNKTYGVKKIIDIKISTTDNHAIAMIIYVEKVKK